MKANRSKAAPKLLTLRPGMNQACTTRDLQHTLLTFGSWIMYNGTPYNIKSKRVGPGVYEVFLKERDYSRAVR